MATPANLYPGLNDLADVLEEIPLEVTKYLTLLYEIDAKCIHILPHLLTSIDSIFNDDDDNNTSSSSNSSNSIPDINSMLQELIPSLEEKMHVSSIMCEIIDKLNKRLDLAYEVAIRNQEIPNKIRLGQDNHPAMHLHYELVQSLLNPQNNNKSNQSTQSAKSESRREAMLANKKTTTTENDTNSGGNIPTPAVAHQIESTATSNTSRKKRKTTKQHAVLTPVPQPSPPLPAPPATTTTTTTTATTTPAQPRVNELGEPVYCYCNQVAYGEMVGCDGQHCELEWFHLPCIGLTTLPKGKWYCDSCKPIK